MALPIVIRDKLTRYFFRSAWQIFAYGFISYSINFKFVLSFSFLRVDPVVKKRIQERETRKQYVINKVKQIKECQDPELKKQLQKELDLFDIQRLREVSRGGVTGF